MAFGMRFFYLAVVPVVAVAVWPQDHSMNHMATHVANWAGLMKNMETMHAAMADVKPSGNDDADFANMMLPHHQAAIDMARTELLYGKDTQMRRLAQDHYRPGIRNSIDAALAQPAEGPHKGSESAIGSGSRRDKEAVF